jgi:hemerythrin
MDTHSSVKLQNSATDFFVWDPQKLLLRIDSLDQEHQGIIRLMNELYVSVQSGESRTRQSERLGKLFKVTVDHFSHEEAYMQKVAYPDFERHRLVHKNLLEKLQKFAGAFNSGQSELGEEFFNFLKVWLASHIAVIDMKYSHHSHERQKVAG